MRGRLQGKVADRRQRFAGICVCAIPGSRAWLLLHAPLMQPSPFSSPFRQHCNNRISMLDEHVCYAFAALAAFDHSAEAFLGLTGQVARPESMIRSDEYQRIVGVPPRQSFVRRRSAGLQGYIFHERYCACDPFHGSIILLDEVCNGAVAGICAH